LCGISGLANFNYPVSLAGYCQAHLRLRHRGQDDEGFWVACGADSKAYRGDDTISEFATLPHIRQIDAANLVLGHRRLSIIDLSRGGHQPMSDSLGRYIMVYNGEIYNYIELRHDLEQAGQQFISQSDSEVLLAAFAQWGADCFNRFNGMWSLAIYDVRQQRLVLSRDRFGIKPLYYALVDKTLYFGSEAKFLIPFLPQLRMNQARAIEYLVHNLVDHHPETMFEGIHQLMPAHYAVWDRSGLTEQAYWRLPDRQHPLGLKEAAEQLTDLLTSSVALRLRSDVPVGSLLSGGLDSTTIVCIVRQLLDQQNANNEFHFFSAVFQEEAFSERRYIEDTVAQTGMSIHWIYPDPEKLLETLPQLLYHQEFPFRSLSVYSQWEVMRHVHQTPIVVLLDGQGSDEIFAGYTAHYYALIAEYVRRLQPAQALHYARVLLAQRDLAPFQILAVVTNELIKASPLRALKRFHVPYLTCPYRPSEGWVRQKDIFRNALVHDLTFSALPEYLRYEDRNSMAFTLESRLPFMDYRLVEWAMSLPPELKIEGAISKRVLRTIARPLIPAAVAERTDKMGFVSPQQDWQRDVLQPALDAAFAQDLQMMFSFLDGKQVKEIYRQYRTGQIDNWAWIWRVACLTWWRTYWWDSTALIDNLVVN
jgi:asparagine synthase (glutamine-hydrolysing)